MNKYHTNPFISTNSTDNCASINERTACERDPSQNIECGKSIGNGRIYIEDTQSLLRFVILEDHVADGVTSVSQGKTLFRFYKNFLGDFNMPMLLPFRWVFSLLHVLSHFKSLSLPPFFLLFLSPPCIF